MVRAIAFSGLRRAPVLAMLGSAIVGVRARARIVAAASGRGGSFVSVDPASRLPAARSADRSRLHHLARAGNLERATMDDVVHGMR